jgi:pyruvate/2-oxoglutarate dehydrogenase complex dihydrolipoamide acyltransferase (E2) component
MIYQLVLPRSMEDIEEFSILEWHAAEGEAVAADGLLVELETQKAVLQVRSSGPVLMRRRLCPTGEWRRLGEPIALLSDRAEERLDNEATADLPKLSIDVDLG